MNYDLVLKTNGKVHIVGRSSDAHGATEAEAPHARLNRSR